MCGVGYIHTYGRNTPAQSFREMPQEDAGGPPPPLGPPHHPISNMDVPSPRVGEYTRSDEKYRRTEKTAVDR